MKPAPRRSFPREHVVDYHHVGVYRINRVQGSCDAGTSTRGREQRYTRHQDRLDRLMDEENGPHACSACSPHWLTSYPTSWVMIGIALF